MRVLVLSWEYPPVVVGGLGRHVHALSTALAAAGHQVTVVTGHGVPGGTGGGTRALPYDEVVDGVRVVRAPTDPPVLAFGEQTLLAWALALSSALGRTALRVVREDGPCGRSDVVHAHDWLVAHAAATVKHALGVPLVATLHATEAGRHQGWLPGELHRAIHSVEWWLTYEARRVVTCSASMRWEVTRLFDLPPDTVDVVPNGVDPAAWRPTPAAVQAVTARLGLDGATHLGLDGATRHGGGPLLLYAGRLVYEKGVHDLLAALPRLRRRHPGLRLVVAGEGPYAAELRAQARRLRLGRSVEWAGFLEPAALAALTAAADCAVVPSRYEPFGMVALEAAAAGTPLVVADTGGLRELVAHGATGLRFAPGDPAGLADAVSAVLRDEVLARRLAREARRVVEREHGWPGIATRTVETYRRAAREELALQAGAGGRAPLRIVVRDGNLLAGADRP